MSLLERELPRASFVLEDVLELETPAGTFAIFRWYKDGNCFYTADQWRDEYLTQETAQEYIGDAQQNGIDFKHKLVLRQGHSLSRLGLKTQEEIEKILELNALDFLNGQVDMDVVPDIAKPYVLYFQQIFLKALHDNGIMSPDPRIA